MNKVIAIMCCLVMSVGVCFAMGNRTNSTNSTYHDAYKGPKNICIPKHAICTDRNVDVMCYRNTTRCFIRINQINTRDYIESLHKDKRGLNVCFKPRDGNNTCLLNNMPRRCECGVTAIKTRIEPEKRRNLFFNTPAHEVEALVLLGEQENGVDADEV